MTEQKFPDNLVTWEHTVSIDGSNVEISFEAEMPGYRHGEYIHSHSRYEVHIPKEAGLKVVFGYETVDLSKDEIIIISPAVTHVCIPENNSRKGFSYSFKKLDDSAFISPLHFKEDYVIFTNRCEAMDIIQKVEQVFQLADSGSDAQISYLVSSLLIDFARALTIKGSKHNLQTLSSKNSTSIIDSFFYIQCNNQLQKKTLARMLSASERQLERIIFTTYGMTFKEKVQKTRFETACYLIKNFGYSIAKTSEIIGYSSEQSFRRAYKKYFGISPRQYSKKSDKKTK